MAAMTLYEKIATYCEENHISGVIRITARDRILHEQAIGFADAARQIPFAKNSMFTLYSLSKPFCAIGLLKLVDAGLVKLDSHPARYVPEAEGFDARVTIRHLLHHTSGLPDFEQNRAFASKYAPGYAKNIREHLRILTDYPSCFSPGTGDKYANINFVICALIIENISGLPYETYMQQEVFSPLDMKTAVVDNEMKIIPNRVTGYQLVDGIPDEIEKSHNWLLGAGDIVGTVEDVYCLNKAIKNRLLLSNATWDAVLTPALLNQRGMGCQVFDWQGKTYIQHCGGHFGFRLLHIQILEDDFDIIFLSNSGYGDARAALADLILDTYYKNGHITIDSSQWDRGYI